MYFFFFFFNDTATTEIYTLSLHDALPISAAGIGSALGICCGCKLCSHGNQRRSDGVIKTFEADSRSEEHTSELQSRLHLVCRLLLEKKKIKDEINSWRP